MTIASCVIHKDNVILSCDSRLTIDTKILTEDANKMITVNNVVFIYAGDCDKVQDIVNMLQYYSTSRLNNRLCLLKYLKTYDFNLTTKGDISTIVIELNDNREVINIVSLSLTDAEKSIEDILLLGIRSIAIGSGADTFYNILTILQQTEGVATYKDTVTQVKKAMSFVSKIDVGCNDNIKTQTFKLKKGA